MNYLQVEFLQLSIYTFATINKYTCIKKDTELKGMQNYVQRKSLVLHKSTLHSGNLFWR